MGLLALGNADFELGAPTARCQESCSILDTLPLARQKHPGQKNNLDALCKRYEVDASGRRMHGALIDAELLALVYLAMTGGQTALSLEDEVGDASHGARASSAGRQAANNLNLVVVRASEEESAAHEAILEKMRASGACVWDD